MKVSSAVWLAGSEESVLRRNDIVILNLRSGISMSARTAISAFWPAAAFTGSVRQTTVPTYCLPLGSEGSSSYSTTRCATGATASSVADDEGWPTRSGIFGLLRGEASFGASTTVVEDLNRPLTVVTSDLPHRIPAPTRISTTPMAIALLNGNTAPVRTRFFGSRSGAIRGRDGRRRVALGLLGGFVIGIGLVGIGAAVLHARLEPVELRRGRGHVGIGLSRRAAGLRRGAAEIVGVGGDIAEAAHARRLRRAVLGAAARRARSFAGRRHRRLLHSDLRLRRLRTRRRVGAKVARRAVFLPERRTLVARWLGYRRRRRRTGARRRSAVWRRGRRRRLPIRPAAPGAAWWRGTHRRHGGRRLPAGAEPRRSA